jgi:hypothetical protein
VVIVRRPDNDQPLRLGWAGVPSEDVAADNFHRIFKFGSAEARARARMAARLTSDCRNRSIIIMQIGVL